MFIIAVIFCLLSTPILESSQRAIVEELVNYGDIYFERILPKQLQTNDFKDRIGQVEHPCGKILNFIDETVFKNLIRKSCDRGWKADLLKNGFISIYTGLCNQKVSKILGQEPSVLTNSLSVLNQLQSESTDQDTNFNAQKFFMHNYNIPQNTFNEIILQEDSWFFTQLYYVGFIKRLDVERSSNDIKKMINQNSLLQTATIIALFEQSVEISLNNVEHGYIIDEISGKINDFIVSSGSKFPYHNLISFYIMQFIKNERMQNAIKQSSESKRIVKLLKIFKQTNIGSFPDNWEKLFLSEHPQKEENLPEEVQNLLNDEQHNIPNPPRQGTKALIFSTVPGIALLLLSQFMKTASPQMKQKFRLSGFVSLFTLPLVVHWISNRR